MQLLHRISCKEGLVILSKKEDLIIVVDDDGGGVQGIHFLEADFISSLPFHHEFSTYLGS